MSRRPVTDRPRHLALLRSLGSSPSPGPTQPSVPTFHILTEASDTITTEAGDFLDIEHV